MRGGVAFGLIGVLALTAMAACGDDDDGGGSGVSAEAKPYVESLQQAMTQDSSDGFKLTQAQAECLAPKFIDAIGVDTLKAKGVTPEDVGADGDSEFDDLGLTEAQGGTLYDGFGECEVDIKSVFISGIGGETELSDEDRTCLEDNFDDALLKQVMVTTLTKGDEALQGDQDLMGKLLGVFSKCPGAVPTG